MDSSNFSNVNIDAALLDWNDRLSHVLIPNNIILVVYLLLGIFGNATVIIVYWNRMKESRDDRYFVPYLAFSDLIACTTGFGFNISKNVMQVTFSNNGLCKAGWFFSSLTQTLSAFMLVIIAVQRYMKVCKPMGKQMTLFWKKIALTLALVVAAILSAPIAIFYGSVSSYSETEKISGYQCARLESNKIASVAYSSILGLIGILNITSLICLYTLIGLKIHRHFRNRRYWKNPTRQNVTTDTNVSRTDKTRKVVAVSGSDGNNGTDSMVKTQEMSADMDTCEGNTCETNLPQAKSRQDKTGRRIVHRFTVMFMLITIVYLLCYVPVCVIIFLESLDIKFWDQFTDSERVGLFIVQRLYIINNFVNPIIYALMDSRFREEMKIVFCNCQK